MNSSKLNWECTQWCKSHQHGASLGAALTLKTASDVELLAYLRWRCCNCGLVTDDIGRSALHLAASCGRLKAVLWLLKSAGANINAKDLESGYTALHRSIFYGQIHVAIALIQLGANIQMLDFDNLTAFDHAMKDRPPIVEFNAYNPCEVYVWGTNSNYTLGTGYQHSRIQPELLDSFRKQDISIRQVAMHKFHTVFICQDGRVFSCGHGQGGRLGLDSEKAALIPVHVKIGNNLSTSMPEVCVAASVGRDHTVLLMESGSVWTCGLNTHHQLGHVPPPKQLLSPRPVPHRFIKVCGTVNGISAARFHTVIWGSAGLVTCGLHGGQLGHSKSSDRTQLHPKQVLNLTHKDSQIVYAAASDGASVAATDKGDIYILHEYKCKKISSRLLDISKIVVVGGHLDSKVDSNILLEKGGEQLKVAVLTRSGKLYLWQESSQQLLRCLFTLNRPLNVKDVFINRIQMLLVTSNGEAFEGEVKNKKIKRQPHDISCSPNDYAFNEFLTPEDCEVVKIKRLPHAHRVISITSDLKSRNFAMIQVHPKAALMEVPMVTTADMKEQMLSLLQQVNTMDNIHDAIFKVKNQEFAVHKFIIASRCEPLWKMIKEQSVLDSEVPIIKLQNIRAEVFQQILQFIYTNDCTILHLGICPIPLSSEDSENSNIHTTSKKTKQQAASKQQENIKKDPVRLVREAARRFNLSELTKRLDNVRYSDGYIEYADAPVLSLPNLKFERKSYENLYDISIKSEDGKCSRAHKCILVARLEYFNNMLNHGWLESSSSNILSLPVPYNVLEVLIDFLYDDEAPSVSQSEDLNFLTSALVISEQLFAIRLKEICEVALANIITLRNVADILQFAATFNAVQLKHCCMQYICINLSAILESRVLEMVNEDILADLSKYYYENNPCLKKRIITPYTDAPNERQLQEISDAHPVVSCPTDEEYEINDGNSKKPLKTPKKKYRSRKISEEGTKEKNRIRNESFSSNASNNSDDVGLREDEKFSFDDLMEKNGITLSLSSLSDTLHENYAKKNVGGDWVEVTGSSNKQQKIVSARLKAIVAASESPSLTETKSDSFTVLSSCSSSTPQNIKQLSTSDFPELQLSPPSDYPHKSNSKTSHGAEIKKPTKLSQKQRRKLLLNSNENATSEVEGSATVSHFSWNCAELNKNSEKSLAEIMREESRLNKNIACSPSSQRKQQPTISTSPSENVWMRPNKQSGSFSANESDAERSFSDILADERKLKDNWAKMRSKPLDLTQIEDQAMEDLLSFYNANDTTEETITVHRVITEAVATPQWITSHSHH